MLSLQWLGLLLWHGFDPWPKNFHMPWLWPKKKKKEEEEEEEKKAEKTIQTRENYRSIMLMN